MPTFSSHVWSGRSGRSKLCLVACLVLSSAVLLIDAKEKVQRAQSAQSAQSAQRGWDVGKAKCCVGKVLRAPDTLILQSLNRITEYVKLKLFLRPSQVSAKENAWLNSAKDEICARFGISPVPELLICDDSRMLAQAGPHGCRGFGNGWVVLSKGVLETLPPQEVVAVLAHELTHVAKNHHLKRGFLILDFYRLMLLWSLKQKEDSAMLDLQTTVATVTMWLLLGLRSRSQEMEADRHMLDIVTPSTAFSALARMHYPLDDPQKVLVDAKELLQKSRWLRLKMFLTGASHPCLPLRLEALEAANAGESQR